MTPLRFLVVAVKTTSLTYRLLTTSILLGHVIIAVVKKTKKTYNKKAEK